MAHTMDALEEWEVIQAGINQDYFSLDSIINDTSSPLQADKVNTTNDNSLPLYRYREPEHLRDHRLLQPDSEHESSETEADAIVSNQEANSVADEDEETGTKKPWPVVWWKSQLDNLFRSFSVVGMSYCKPFWCMSVIATMFSFVILKKRIFGMKHKQRTVSTRRKFFSIAKALSMHSGYDSIQKETQFAASTVQLNQTLLVVRHIPVIKIIPPVADANPWAIVHVKQTGSAAVITTYGL